MLICKKPEYRPWASWAGQDRLYRTQQAHLLTGTPSEPSLLTPLCCCIWYLHFTQRCQVSPAPWVSAGCQLEHYLPVGCICYVGVAGVKVLGYASPSQGFCVFLSFHAPHPICQSPVPEAPFSPHCCQCPAVPLLQPVALGAPPALLASPAVMLCISPTVTSQSILSFLFSQPAVQVVSSRMGKTCKAEIANRDERDRGY